MFEKVELRTAIDAVTHAMTAIGHSVTFGEIRDHLTKNGEYEISDPELVTTIYVMRYTEMITRDFVHDTYEITEG